MHLISLFSVMVTIVCILIKANPLVNKDMVDLVLVFDLDSRIQITDAQSTQHEEEMKTWIKGLWKSGQSEIYKSIESKKMHVAIEYVPKSGRPTTTQLSTGISKEVLDQWSTPTRNIEKAPSKHNVDDVVKQIKQDVFGKNGDRDYAPNIIVYFAMQLEPIDTAEEKFNDWFDEAKKNSKNFDDFAAVDIAMVVQGWKKESFMAIVYKNAADKFDREDLIMRTGEHGHSVLKEAIGKLLGRCNFMEAADDETKSCSYFEGSPATCKKNSTLIPKPLDNHAGKYCLKKWVGKDCKNSSICDAVCAEKEKWMQCNCESGKQFRNTSAERHTNRTKFCPPKPTARPCDSSASCPKSTTEVDADAPVLPMPVWALAVTTFFVLVIFTVITTLIVYYVCFPEPKDFDRLKPGKKHWAQRFDDTMRSFMPSRQTRYGGQSTYNQSRGGTTMTTNVSRTRR